MKKIILAFTLLSTINLIAGGGWTLPKGDGYFLLSQRRIAGGGYYNSFGNRIGSPNLGVFTTHLYAEYGITDKLTGILHSPFVTALTREGGVDGQGNIFTADNALGFGDIDLGAKYNLINGWIQLAAELTLGLPTGNYNAGETGTLHLGDDEFNQLLKIHVSKGFNWGIFASGFGGFNNRTNGFSNEIHYGGELGIKQFGFTAIGKLYIRQSLFNQPRKDTFIPGIYSDNLEYVSFGAQLLYTFKNGLGLMVEQATAASGRNIVSALSYSGGIIWELKHKDKNQVTKK